MKIACGRVSSKDQNPQRQILKFRELGVDERYIFVDKLTGRNFERPQYQAMRLLIREGDLIYMDALDRLGRDYDGIISEWKYITRQLNADIVCLDNQELFDSRKFKTMGDIGNLLEDQFLSMLAYVAEQERKKNRERQAEGIEVARADGVKFGRPKHEIDQHFIQSYAAWKGGDFTAKAAMLKLGMSRTTFYRRVKEYEDRFKK
ncbi:recombinase family protein [Paenibacillus daejeonensis]|uniref:recombinase family protein n=1 Tax=Paenibacillus daejeonensis TaxID=135193 RepID=UPI0003680F28|nr:recombinase family protein [Paenibacillus daejeonensis]